MSSKLTNFIQYRNDISHGSISPEEILGFEELIDLVEFIESLAVSLDQLILWEIVKVKQDLKKVTDIGKITEVFSKAKACILLSEGAELNSGQEVYVKKAGGVCVSTIKSIQINSTDVTYVKSTKGDEVGLQVIPPPEKGSLLFVDL